MWLFLWREQDRQVARALADPRCPSQGARPVALDRRTLVGMDRLDVQVLADELVVVLRVCDRRLEQLAPVPCDRARRVSQDSSRLFDALAADVVAYQPRLARAGADVFGLRSYDGRREARIAIRLSPTSRSRLRGWLLGLGLSGASAPSGCGLGGRLGFRFGLG